ncbi:mucoidy inhibitor MuiA family protein [Plantactinospora sp. KBS50]|uniref:mucoidy inhibitor MuiA family protein n=1 Tax=Plantactinospora sp. KBS50 TaxID=2024580 RepID=UPI002100BAD1|nr:mucoidy inhibitor MuiA family protein [Plantactinospora sp. KBS50]
MEPEPIDASVVAVTVFPDQARVTRRGRATLPAGEHRIRVAPLPAGANPDSLRVSGRGPATVLGVDTSALRAPRSTDEEVVELTRRRSDLAEEQAGLIDADEVQQRRDTFLAGVAERAAGTYARALAAGDAAAADLAAFSDAIAEQSTGARERMRQLARRRVELDEEIAAVDRALQALAGKRGPDQLAADVTVLVDEAGGEVEIELTYLVGDAGWRPAYDLRLVDETVGVTWFGLISQHTGEDWPECDLRLSTARPAASAAVPELTPWYLDRVRPVPPPPRSPGHAAPMMPMAAARGAGGSAAEAAPRLKQGVATMEQGPCRPPTGRRGRSRYRPTAAATARSWRPSTCRPGWTT